MKLWKWCIEYSDYNPKHGSLIAPIFFASERDARDYRSDHMPHGKIKRVIAIVITEPTD